MFDVNFKMVDFDKEIFGIEFNVLETLALQYK